MNITAALLSLRPQCADMNAQKKDEQARSVIGRRRAEIKNIKRVGKGARNMKKCQPAKKPRAIANQPLHFGSSHTP